MAATLWQLALALYIMVMVNLNPLLEYDRYYILVDLLERPNLRPRALAWLGRELPRVLCRSRTLLQRRLEVLYGLGSMLYIAAMALLNVLVCRLTLQGWISHLVRGVVAASLAWVLAGALVLLSAVSIVGELRGVRPGK